MTNSVSCVSVMDVMKNKTFQHEKRETSMAENHIKISVDLDGVCAKYNDYLREVVAEHSGYDAERLPEPEFYSFVESGWPLRDENEYAEVHCNAVAEGLYRKLDSIDGSTRVLHQLAEKGHHLRVVTARFVRPGQHAQVCSDTVEWLDHAIDENDEVVRDEDGEPMEFNTALTEGVKNIRRRVPYEDICFTALKQDINVDVYIDDSPSNIYRLSTETKGQVLIFNTLYNKHDPRYGNLDQYGIRVYGWDENSLDDEGKALAMKNISAPTVKSVLEV